MMKYRHNILLSLFTSMALVLFSGSLFALDLTRKLTNADCRVIEDISYDTNLVAKFSDALLWKVSKEGRQPSYVFGTIHVSDPRITNLPEPVETALKNSDIFVMEALPTPEEALSLAQMMFYADGTTLKDYLDDDLFNRTAKVLSNFQLPIEAVSVMRPWAAFLLMNYPADNTMPLDLKLLEIAMSQGARTIGLETLSEQGAVFSEMALDDQFRLLLDTLCNYDLVMQDIEEMKRLYLKKDLNGLLNTGTQHAYSDEQVYKELNKRLLTDRNKIMADRMQAVLQEGDAFIAIGALHLPGNEGVIARLSQQGYKITAIY
ncbi:MAG: TraB/GumN family protein [Gammaproteobacteria bacterium]